MVVDIFLAVVVKCDRINGGIIGDGVRQPHEVKGLGKALER